jgi:hypothetical protein
MICYFVFFNVLTLHLRKGHGSRVCGVLAGSTEDGIDNEADGIARDAKIHLWDIQKEAGQ